MRVAVINEVSAAGKNADILKALAGRGFEVLNLGNRVADETPPLQYIHTGLLAGLVLHLKIADFVVGGCGTGLGFVNSALMYPGVICGHLLTPLDAWLFARINAGNCISLALNQGYGWAGEVNMGMIFDALFTPETGAGFPPHRVEPQRKSRELLSKISLASHRTFPEILKALPLEVSKPVLEFPTFKPVLLEASQKKPELLSVIKSIL